VTGAVPAGTAAALCLALSACAVGPNYRPPPTPPGAAGPFVSTTPEAETDQPPRSDWWRLYDDPVLDRLVVEALTENADVKVAAANFANAESLLSEARTGLLPTTDVDLAATYGRTATGQLLGSLSGAQPKTNWVYSAAFSLNYQIDVFGRVRRTIEAAHANADALRAAEDSVRVTVAASTAQAYANVCAFAEQAEVARRSLAIAQQTYDITTQQRNVGAASDFDVERAATVLEQARAVVPTLDGQRKTALLELTALLGKTPAEAPQDADACERPPRINQPLPVGDGAALIRRRPDVRQAERTLAAATARIGVAAADLYPTVSLGGTIADAANSVAAVNSPSSITFGVGPLIHWTFPNIAVALTHVREARATASGAIASFDSVVLTALKETEQGLTGYASEIDHHAALTAARDHAKAAFNLAQIQYRLGSLSFLDLLTAQTTLTGAEQALAASDQALITDQVAVFQALGGGWEHAPLVTIPKVPG
jgi:NodT family efflux transporter outer membrane factor (OMF) lipoprotein